MQIAIDGPAGSGKSTLAKRLAARLGLIYLDTGAMYRAFAYKTLQQKLNPADAAVAAILDSTDLQIRRENDQQQVWIDGCDVTAAIRTPEVSEAASVVSTNAKVRQWMVARQQQIAARQPLVMDGRDIGTVVLPQADFKFFLTGTITERAKRRQLELRERGIETQLEQLEEEIRLRDERDSTRSASPLKKAPDALEIDTTELTIDEVENAMLQVILKGG